MTNTGNTENCFLCSKSKTFQEFISHSNQLFRCSKPDCGDYQISAEGMKSIATTPSNGVGIKYYLRLYANRARNGNCVASIGEMIKNNIKTVYV